MPLDANHAFGRGPAYRRPGPAVALLASALDAADALVDILRAARVWRQFERHATCAGDVRLGPHAWCVGAASGRDRIRLDAGAVCRGLLRVELWGSGQIAVGAGTYIGDDCLVSSAAGVEIGEGTLLAHGVQIFDNNTHPLDPVERERDRRHIFEGTGSKPPIKSAPIHIGRNVWIGFSSIILKGVHIGDNAIVAAGSVVTESVPANVVVGGNPARALRDSAVSDVHP